MTDAFRAGEIPITPNGFVGVEIQAVDPVITIANDWINGQSTNAPLAASASWTSADIAANPRYTKLHIAAAADVAGTLYVDVKAGNNYYPAVTQAVAAASGTIQVVDMGAYGAVYRVRYVNGAAAQTAFALNYSTSS